MKLISLDLEMNNLPEVGTMKIIEIGYTIFDPRKKKIDKTASIIVNPNEALNPDIIELTGITQEMVDVGVTLQEAYAQMVADINDYQCTRHSVEWGTDAIWLRDQLGIAKRDYVFRERSYDVKSLYQMYMSMKPQGKVHAGLGKALAAVNLGWEDTCGKPHRAVADSLNTVRMYLHLVEKMVMFDRVERTFKEQG